jgi:hypothetical protein
MPILDRSTDSAIGDADEVVLGIEAVDLPTKSVQFFDIEDMQDSSRARGWNIDYRQIQPGRSFPRMVFAEYADISLVDEHVDRRVEIAGESPNGHMSITTKYRGNRDWVNGLLLDSQSILLVKPNTEIHVVTGEDSRTLSMHIPTDLLRQLGSGICEPRGPRNRGRSTSIDPDPHMADMLTRLMYIAIHGTETGRQRVEQASNLAVIASKLIDRSTENPDHSRRLTADESLRTIKCAREYIEAHLSEAIPISDICTKCCVSCSKLERIFRREIALSPTEYILARRLVAVRSDKNHVF